MRPVVISFYSYKGGVGRTLLAANMALALARNGKTLLWDLDAEAPGLHRIKALRTGAVKSGYFDWLIDWQNKGRHIQLDDKQLEDFSKLLYATPYTDFCILPALGDQGDPGDLYFSIDWNYLLVNEPDRGRELFNVLIDYLGTIGYRHILLDSRTGLTDLAGLAAGIIADATVLVGNYGAQNLHGLAHIRNALIADTEQQRSLRGSDRPLTLFYVASPIPQDDAKLVAAGKELWAKAFELELASVHQIRYESELPFSEGLLLRDPDRGIAKDYQRFADVLTEFIDTVLEDQDQEQSQIAERADIFGADGQDSRFSRRPLDAGQRFEEQVANLLQMLGYSVETGLVLDGKPVAMLARIESAFDTFVYLVECKTGNMQKTAVQDMALALAQPEARAMQARGMLVGRSFSPAALRFAKEQGMQAATLDELERKLLDFGPYLNKIIAAFEQMPLAAAYVTQRAHPGIAGASARPERAAQTGYGGGDGDDAVIGDLTVHGLAWAHGKGSRLWVLLGDYGTGKTAYTQKLEYEMAKLARDDSNLPVPIRINLRDIPNKVSLEEVLAEHWQRSTRQRKDPKILLHLIARGRLVLLLDSFDEMGLAASGRSVVEQFRSLAHISGGQGDATLANRVLITCREQFFRDHGEAANVAGGREGSGVAVSALHGVALGLAANIDTVAMFDQRQIAEFLNKRLGETGGAAALAFLRQQHLQELGDRPQLLDIIIQSLPALKEREAQSGERLSTGALYQIYTNRWLDDFKPVERQSSSEQLRAILEVLAHLLWQREGNRIHYGDLYAMLKSRGDLRGKLDPNQLDIELRTAAFLSRTPDGMYGFSHRSFLEYFFAERIISASLAASAQTPGLVLGEVLDVARLSPEICGFAHDLAALGKAAGTEGQGAREMLRLALCATLQEGGAGAGIDAGARARANALMLAYRIALAQTGGVAVLRGVARQEFVAAQQEWIPQAAWLAGIDLSGMDFSGLSVVNADLSGALLEDAVFTGANWSGARLRQAKLARATLHHVDARGADLQDADCSECGASGIRLDGALAQNSCWVNAQLDGAGLAQTDFSGADLRAARLARAQGEALWSGALLQGASARGAVDEGLATLRMPRLADLALAPVLGCATVLSLAYGPDGRRIASGGVDGMLRLLDAQTGRLLHCQEQQKMGATRVAISPDGQVLASAGGDSVRLWDARDGACLRELAGHQGTINVAFGAGGLRLATLDEKTLRLWDVRRGELLFSVEHQQTSQYGWWALDFAIDGRFVATGGDDVKLWDGNSVRLLRRFETGVKLSVNLSFSRDGQRLASAGFEALRVWDTESGQACWEVQESFLCLGFSPDGQELLTGDTDGKVSLWQAQTGNALRHIQTAGGPVWSLAWRPDGEQFACAGENRKVDLWAMARAKRLRSLGRDGDVLSSLACSLDGRQVLCGDKSGTLSLWDVRRGVALRFLQGHQGTVVSVAMRADKQRWLTGGDDKLLRLWDADSGQAIQTFTTIWLPLCVALGSTGAYVAAGGGGGAIAIWDQQSQQAKNLQHSDRKYHSIRSLAFSPDESLLVSGAEDHAVALWDTQSGVLRHHLEYHKTPVTCLAFSPDGRILASAGSDGIHLSDADSGQSVQCLRAQAGDVLGMAFSHDGQQLTAVYRDGTLRVWQPQSGKLLATRQLQHDGSVWGASLSANGQLAIAGWDGGVRLYDIDDNHNHPTAQTSPCPLAIILYADDQKSTERDPAAGNPATSSAASWYSVDFRQDTRGLWRGAGPALASLCYRETGDTLQPWPWLPRDWRAEDVPELAAPDIE